MRLRSLLEILLLTSLCETREELSKKRNTEIPNTTYFSNVKNSANINTKTETNAKEKH